jgi:hypothetical protein
VGILPRACRPRSTSLRRSVAPKTALVGICPTERLRASQRWNAGGIRTNRGLNPTLDLGRTTPCRRGWGGKGRAPTFSIPRDPAAASSPLDAQRPRHSKAPEPDCLGGGNLHNPLLPEVEGSSGATLSLPY